MTKLTPLPRWAHAVENIGGMWWCSGSGSSGVVSRESFQRCSFVSSDTGEAMAHVAHNQYDARYEKPLDMRAA